MRNSTFVQTSFLLGCSFGTSLLMGSCAGFSKTDNTSSKKPNVIFIVADDLGYGDISCYGEKTVSTPHVDSLAACGIRFTDAHSVAATSTPSRYSLLPGTTAGEGVTRVLLPEMREW